MRNKRRRREGGREGGQKVSCLHMAIHGVQYPLIKVSLLPITVAFLWVSYNQSPVMSPTPFSLSARPSHGHTELGKLTNTSHSLIPT